LDKCVDRLVQLAKNSGVFFGSEVIRSIANLCGKEFIDVWNYIYKLSPSIESQQISKPQKVAKSAPCWRCPVCGKEFNNPRTAMNHILYLSRQGDASHRELYIKLKNEASASGKKFLELITEKCICSST